MCLPRHIEKLEIVRDLFSHMGVCVQMSSDNIPEIVSFNYVGSVLFYCFNMHICDAITLFICYRVCCNRFGLNTALEKVNPLPLCVRHKSPSHLPPSFLFMQRIWRFERSTVE